MVKAGHWEPDKSRGSCTVLGARGGETPSVGRQDKLTPHVASHGNVTEGLVSPDTKADAPRRTEASLRQSNDAIKLSRDPTEFCNGAKPSPFFPSLSPVLAPSLQASNHPVSH